MNTLRRAHAITRFMLVCMGLCLFAAVASPLIKPQAMNLVCSAAGGVKLIDASGQGEPATGLHHTLDCPACLSFIAPLPAVPQVAEPAFVHGRTLPLPPVSRVASLALRHWLARGPPTVSA